jgi:hypothetical protein
MDFFYCYTSVQKTFLCFPLTAFAEKMFSSALHILRAERRVAARFWGEMATPLW